MAWSTETGEWERAEDENWDRDNCGLRYRVFVQMVHLHLFYLFGPNGAFHTFCFLLFCFFVFFFFWISTWIGRFSTSICGCGRYRPIRHKSAWISPIQRKSARVCAVLAWVMKPKQKKSWTRHWRVGSSVPHASPCRAASDAGATVILPRSCIPEHWLRWRRITIF